jgi:hypothetical protein
MVNFPKTMGVLESRENLKKKIRDFFHLKFMFRNHDSATSPSQVKRSYICVMFQFIFFTKFRSHCFCFHGKNTYFSTVPQGYHQKVYTSQLYCQATCYVFFVMLTCMFFLRITCMLTLDHLWVHTAHFGWLDPDRLVRATPTVWQTNLASI